MSAAVDMRRCSVAYPGGEAIIRDCTFTLRYGELAVLSGLSGEGKTTLLSAINGLIPNAVAGEIQGEVTVDGLPVAGMKMADIARRVGTVLQNPDSQIFHSRVADEIAFGCENLNMPAGEIERRIKKSCALLGLDPDAPTKMLSGGQKQRLMTACVFAMGQKILLLDEPLANLDTAGARLLLGRLRELCAQGYAVLLAEHRLDIVLPYADRFFVLADGAVQEAAREALTYGNTRKIDGPREGVATDSTALAVRQAAYGAGKADILTDIGLEIKKGERIVVLGENGCGKTTLLRLVAGLIKPTAGEIRADISHKPGSRRWFRHVGYVYQEPSYQLFMPTVRDEICGSAAAGLGERYMERFGLADLAQQHPHSLSEGQKRRVSIAAVMATAPEVVLLDEPTVGQDYDNLRRLVEALNQIHAEAGNTMITITHDIRCAEALCDRAVWIREGRVYRQGGRELIRTYFEEG